MMEYFNSYSIVVWLSMFPTYFRPEVTGGKGSLIEAFLTWTSNYYEYCMCFIDKYFDNYCA